MMPMETGDWLAQARRGVLEMCVLVLVGGQPRYGYELTAALAEWDPLAATDGTLYPLLRRLQHDGLIAGAWQESATGPPRKYYHLTSNGAVLLSHRLAGWDRLTHAVSLLRAATPAPSEVLHADGRHPALPGRSAAPSRPPARA
jgi:PadR family transcriptional regulator, regulatory protein PadR